jgi:hypothetical protein
VSSLLLLSIAFAYGAILVVIGSLLQMSQYAFPLIGLPIM